MRQRLLTILGTACCFPILRGDFFGTFFLNGSKGTGLLLALNFLTIGFSAALCLARRGAAGFLMGKRGRTAAAALCSLSTICMLVIAFGGSGVALTAVSLPLAGYSFCLLCAMWFAAYRQSYAADTGSRFMSDMAIAYLLSYILTPPAPDAPFTVVKALLPFASALCWLSAFPLPAERARTGQEAPSPTGPLLRSATMMMVVLLVSGILVGIFVPARGAGGTMWVRYCSSVLLACGLAAFCLIIKDAERKVSPAFAGVMAIFLGSLLLISTSPEVASIGSDVLTAGRRFMWTLFWIMVARAACRGALEGALLLGALFPAAFSATRIPINALRIMGPAEILSPQTSYLVSVALAAFLIAFSLVLAWSEALRIHGSASQSVKPDKSADDLRSEAIRAIGDGCGLTERERETLRFLSQGYTVKRIAESLSVSESTVRSRTKAIYRKMGCHSKQELIELVDETAHEPRDDSR